MSLADRPTGGKGGKELDPELPVGERGKRKGKRGASFLGIGRTGRKKRRNPTAVEKRLNSPADAKDARRGKDGVLAASVGRRKEKKKKKKERLL